MPDSSSQAFLRELDKKLWSAADKLPSSLDVAVYKHAVRFIEEHGGTTGNIMILRQYQWAWSAHLRRAQRARRVRLRWKRPNQSNPTTWRLAAMNMAKTFPRQSKTESDGIDFDYVTSTQAKRNRIVDRITGLGAAFSDPIATPLRL